MAIIAKSSGGGNFIPCPSGQHSAVCVDIVDMGILEVKFGKEAPKSQHKIRIVWQVEEVMADNRPFIVQRRYTLSLHEKATLRKDLESWRGKQFTAEELEGFDLEVLLGIPCLLNVIQEKKDGSTYANVASIMRLPKVMTPIKQRDYIRVQDRTPAQTAEAEQDHGAEPDWVASDADVAF
jgi:hypothetical protein